MRHALPLILALVSLALVPARAKITAQVTSSNVPPVFLTGTSESDTNPYYTQSAFDTLPVGKTLVLPIVVSGSGPMSYTATSSSPSIYPFVKTGYPVMNIEVSYAGSTSLSGSFNTLYAFTGGTNGAGPYAGLLADTAGGFFGTTESGTTGGGTVFELSSSGSFSTLHAFTTGSNSSNGANPYAGLVTGTDGNFYGTTETGGTNGAGTVYMITASGSLATLYSFSGGGDGGNPYGGLVTGSDGALYGTTATSGSGAGTVFRITVSGSFSTLYTFSGGNDGGDPEAGLITGTDGALYGTTVQDGTFGAGTVFRVTTTGSLATLYPFTGGADGEYPYGSLVENGGIFYGTTETGGTGGSGTVFSLSASGSLATLHTFGALSSGTNADGAHPYAGLLLGSGNVFYGTTETGGTGGSGTVFQMTSAGAVTTVHSFSPLSGGTNADGADPFAPVVQTSAGLYGTARDGGANGDGVIFQVPLTGTTPFSGTMTFALLRDMAPITTGYIAGFAEAGYYNNTDFFRITNLASTGEQPQYIAQGGDPTETGTGSTGFSFDNEISPSLIFTGLGQLAMANAGTDFSTYRGTNGSQFFFTGGPIRSLDFKYTIFGQLLQGFDVMQKVLNVPVGSDGSTPTVPVVMKSVTISEDNTDAILLVTAPAAAPSNGVTITVKATDPKGNKAVVVSGTTSTPNLTLAMDTMTVDTVNDPPIINPVSNVTTVLNQRVSIPLKTEDLEFDYLITGTTPISNSSSATLGLSGNLFTVNPYPVFPLGSVTEGFYVYEPFISGNPENETAVTIGLGSGKLTPMPVDLTGVPANPNLSSTTFGSFLDSNPAEVPADFTATINWGDGKLTSGTGSAPVVNAPNLPTTFDVASSAGHYYSNPGIYPVNVTVTDTYGAILNLQNTAVISNGPIYAFGRTFTAAKGAFDGLVGTFIDKTGGYIAADYQATINWGDGSVSTGVIRGSNPNYQIFGKHTYTSGNSFPVDLTVQSLISSGSAYAWSIARPTGIPSRQPPFAQAHVVGEIGSPGYGSGYLDEEITLFNSGNLASGAITLKFYLSITPDTDPVAAGAIPLQVGKGTTYNTVSIPAGSAISGAVSDIFIPSNVNSRGKYIIMQVITSDPIGNHMDYPRYFADPYPLIE